jgi:site-specific recombinase XerC
VANVRRPHVGQDSPTIGLDAAELDRLLTAAEHDSPRSAALISLLVYNGLRIAEALGCDVTSLSYLSTGAPGPADHPQGRPRRDRAVGAGGAPPAAGVHR